MRFGFAICLVPLLVGCGSITHRSYGPFTRQLDEKSELAISTYPAWYPKDSFSIPLLYKNSKTHDKVYFQVHVRDAKKKFGKNPSVESCQINSFSYRLDGGEWTNLLSGYPNDFWMQNNSRYEERELPPIPYQRDSRVGIEIDLTLNGTRHDIQGEMPAKEQTSFYPLVLELMR